MPYRLLEHPTDAVVEVDAETMEDAFAEAARAAIAITLDPDKVEQTHTMEFSAEGRDTDYLLFSWLEEIVFVMITRGFAIGRLEFDMDRAACRIRAVAHGEPLDIAKHGFKVEIKAPTFHDMQIRQGERTYMRFLLDL